MEGLIGVATVEKNGLQKANTALGLTGEMGKYKVGVVEKGLISCTFIVSINNTYSPVCGTYLIQLISPPGDNTEVKLRHKILMPSDDTISFHARIYNEQVELYVDAKANFCMRLLLSTSPGMKFTYDIKSIENIPEDCIASSEIQ